MWNQMNRPQVRDEDNAWPHYEKAIPLFVEPDRELRKIVDSASGRVNLEGMNEEDEEEIRKWVKLNEAAWQEFVAASSKSYCYREYSYNDKDKDKWPFNILLPPLREIRGLARLGCWQALIHIDANQPNQAIENCLAIARAGSHWQRKGTLIEQLVGLGVSGLAYMEMLNIVATKELSSIDLKQVQEKLLQIYPQSFPLMNMEGERIAFLDMVQHLFTEGGPGGGHIIPGRLSDFQFATDFFDSELHTFRLPFYTAAAMVHVGRDETIAKCNEIYDRLGKLAKMSPYEKHISDPNGVEGMISTLPKYRYFLIHLLMPAIDRVSEIAYRGKASHQATITVLALRRWRLEKNEYPAHLDELVAAGYLKELPADPFSDKPLVYKKAGDDFTLYSVGSNFTDDGGESGKDSNGRPTKWRDDGDTVFWPVPEFKQEHSADSE
jgi:hypothetical protein